MKRKLLYVANVDWYFKLHWMNRAMAAIRSGFSVKLLASFSSPAIKAEIESRGIECFDVNLSRSGIGLLSELKTLWTIYKTINAIKPSLVHSITVKPNLYAGISCRCLDIPLVKSVTGTGAVFSSDSVFFRCLKPIIVWLYRFIGGTVSGRFVFENKEDLATFAKLRITEHQMGVHIPGAGVDPDIFLYKDNLFSGNKLKLLFAARLLKDKGLDTLIAALDEVYKTRQDFELSVAGLFDNHARNSYSECEIFALTSRPYVTWLGARDDMAYLLVEHDVVVLPTRYGEGIPRILIEAGFVGRVVVTTDVPGCRELIQDLETGYLIPPGDIERLKNTISHIFNNKERALFYARNLYATVVNDYSDAVVVGRFLSLYSSVSEYKS